MKKFSKLLLIFFLLPFLGKSQKVALYSGLPQQTSIWRGAGSFDSGLYIGSGCGNPNTIIPPQNVGRFYGVRRGALIYKDTCQNSVWTSNPDSTWTRLNNFFDTTGLHPLQLQTNFVDNSTQTYLNVQNSSTIVWSESGGTWTAEVPAATDNHYAIEDNVGLENRLINYEGYNHEEDSLGEMNYYSGDIGLTGVASNIHLDSNAASYYSQLNDTTKAMLSTGNDADSSFFLATATDNVNFLSMSGSTHGLYRIDITHPSNINSLQYDYAKSVFKTGLGYFEVISGDTTYTTGSTGDFIVRNNDITGGAFSSGGSQAAFDFIDDGRIFLSSTDSIYTTFYNNTDVTKFLQTTPSGALRLATVPSTDTTSLSNRINNKVDTIYRTPGKDSIQFTIGGRYHAIKDSTGIGTAVTTWSAGTTGFTPNTGTGGAVTMGWITTPYAILTGGTTSTNAFQQVSTGSTGQLLQSNGSSALPSWSSDTALWIRGASALSIELKPARLTDSVKVDKLSATSWLRIPASSSTTVGVIRQGTGVFIHTFGGLFIGTSIDNGLATAGGTFSTTADRENLGIGAQVLTVVSSGYFNLGIGRASLNHVTDGHGNAALGISSLTSVSSGSDNVGIGGIQCLELVTTGSTNVGLGARAGHSVTTGSGGVYLGYKAGEGDATGGRFYISNESNNNNGALLFGDFTANAKHLVVNNTINPQTAGFISKVIFEVRDTMQASIPAPLQTTAQRDLYTPSDGMMIYNTTTHNYQQYNNAAWVPFIAASAVNSISPTAPNRTITVIIDGNTYYIAAKTTND